MQFSSEVPQVPGVLHLNPVFISAENPPPSLFCTFQRKHEPLICIIQNVPCVLHVCACVRVRLGMRIDLFSAFPNLIIHTGLGTGPTQWAREKKLVTDENGTDKNEGDLQRKKKNGRGRNIKNTPSSPELGHCFFSAAVFLSKTDADRWTWTPQHAILRELKDPLLLATLD